MRTRTALAATALLAIGVLIGSLTTIGAQEKKAAAEPTPRPSAGWAMALPPCPDTHVKITEAYARHVGGDAYFWAWPMVNMYNRRLYFSGMKEHRYVGPLMEVPINRLTMLTDYVDPAERNVACPNQDVVYGIGSPRT